MLYRSLSLPDLGDFDDILEFPDNYLRKEARAQVRRMQKKGRSVGKNKGEIIMKN